MRVFIFVLSFVLFLTKSFAQSNGYVNFNALYSNLGERDDKGIGAGMSFGQFVKNGKMSIGSTMAYIASNDLNSSDVTNLHNRSLFMVEADVSFFLIKKSAFSLSLALAPSTRHRHEWVTTRFKQEIGKPLEVTDSENTATFDFGLKEQVAVRASISSKLFIGGFAEMRQYNNGTPLASVGMQLGLMF